MVDPARRMEQLSYGMDTPGLPVLLTSRQIVERLEELETKMLFLIMILPARVRSDEDGANPMGLYLMATCRNFLVYFRKGNYYGWE